MKLKFLVMPVLLVALILTPAAALAETTAETDAAAIDTVWTLISAFLVFFMQAGFAMVEAGFTQAKNAANIVMKNLMDFAIGSLAFWAVGFALMFGAGNLLIGKSGFFTVGDFSHLGLVIPVSAFFIFQTVFAGTSATIVSGAMAERTKYSSYLVFSAVISGFIYPVVGHWVWGGGWLGKLGFLDFAGSTVVHSVGGWAALAGTLLLGPRVGRYNPDGSRNPVPGHNLVYSALGVFILWFGWFGFNPGSTLSGTNLAIADIAVTTNLSAAAGAMVAMLTSWTIHGKADVGMTMNGALAGLVGITAGCAYVSPLSSVIIGALSGVIVVFSVEFFDIVHVDDPVGAISVHGICGVFGTLAVGLFAKNGGLFFGGGYQLLSVQALGVASVFAWTFTASLLLFYAVRAIWGLRVPKNEELEGLDINEHGAWAYPDTYNNGRPKTDIPGYVTGAPAFSSHKS